MNSDTHQLVTPESEELPPYWVRPCENLFVLDGFGRRRVVDSVLGALRARVADDNAFNPPNVSAYECFPNATRAACDTLGGTDIAGRWCVLDGAYTMIGPLCDDRDVTECDEINQRLKQACEKPKGRGDGTWPAYGVYIGLGGTDVADGTFCIVEGTWAVVELYAYYSACRGVTIRTDGSNAVCIFDLSLDDPESDSATGSVPRALLVLLLPGLLALGLL